MSISNSIIPKNIYFIKDNKIYNSLVYGSELDFESICVWLSTGFFLGDTTFFKDLKVLKPSHTFNNGTSTGPEWDWHYAPRNISFSNIVDEFIDLFETIVKDRFNGKKVILPLSGGLDSRTLGIALQNNQLDVETFTYYFQGGHNESYYGKLIADALQYPHKSYVVEPGYLWNDIDRISKINGSYTEFTHPRQAAFLDYFNSLDGVFCLGHWGDVLFDNLGLDNNITFEEEVHILKSLIIKKGGYHLANTLWEVWGLNGHFDDYMNEQLESYLSLIKINGSPNSRIRAFKSLHWAPRWNLVNLEYFRYSHQVEMPYYDDSLCKFICSVPEEYLSSRKIQIEYIKRFSPALAKQTWQEHRPFNLYNYHFDTFPLNLPYRIIDKIRRIMKNKDQVSMNWQLQFLGKVNNQNLYDNLFEKDVLRSLVPDKTVKLFYNLFTKNNPKVYAHAISMLLTLSQFQKNLIINEK